MRAYATGCLFGLMVSVSGGCAFAQGTTLPWGQHSDMVSWEVFVQITAPSGNPQSPGVEFESWASNEDIYTQSPKWPAVNAPKRLQVSGLANIHRGPRPEAINPSQCVQDYDKAEAKAAGFPQDGCIGEEVRRNWASFQYIVSNDLFSKAGLAKAFQNNFKVDLPADAIEFKGDWARVTDVMHWHNLTEQQVNELFYTNSAANGTSTERYALIAFHFSSKQIKDWVWADFEHQLNPGRCDDIGCHDSFGATVADVSARTPANQQYGQCVKSPAVDAMFKNAGTSPVWRNYCLKGSQVTFVDSGGAASLLGNSVIERINAGVPIKSSSCISCHGYASFGKDGFANGDAASANFTGKVDPAQLKGFVTNDFLWGIVHIR